MISYAAQTKRNCVQQTLMTSQVSPVRNENDKKCVPMVKRRYKMLADEIKKIRRKGMLHETNVRA